jgi:hypothetical protein
MSNKKSTPEDFIATLSPEQQKMFMSISGDKEPGEGWSNEAGKEGVMCSKCGKNFIILGWAEYHGRRMNHNIHG